MQKKLLLILALLCAVAQGLVLTACSSNDDNTVESESPEADVYNVFDDLDYFQRAIVQKDAEGNLSQEATVLIRIEKQKQPVVYEDMEGRAGGYAAAALCESGLFIGDKIGGSYCFHPDRAITRGEFLRLCMLATDQPLLEGVMRSGYSDDESLSPQMRQIVVTAAMSGICWGA